MAIHSMRWIAYFFALFFLVECDNSESEEDLELIKEQTDIIHYENTTQTKVIRATLLENGTNEKILNQLHQKNTFYQKTYHDSSILDKQDSIQLLFNTHHKITTQLDLVTLYYNFIYNSYPTEEHPRTLIGSNFLIQTELVNNTDSLEIHLYITSNPSFTVKHKQLTTSAIIDKIEKDYECKVLHRAKIAFNEDSRYLTYKNHLLNYLDIYNYDKVSNRQKSFRLNKIESEFYSSFDKDYFKKKIKTTTTNTYQIQVNKIDFIKSYRDIFGANCIKYSLPVPNTIPEVYTILDFQYLIKHVSLLGNSDINKKQSYKNYYTIKVATKDIKTNYIQLDVEFEQEYGNPKHYKTNKVPFKIIEQ